MLNNSDRTPTIHATEVEDRLSRGYRLLDVREPYEFQAGHIKGALHIPLSNLAQEFHKIVQEHKYVVVCRSGARSNAVTEMLLGQGVEAVNLSGGLQSWLSHGKHLITASGGSGSLQ
ncbi:MAG: rhodanese-like domain-containing protein [Acidimicrobiaceae bacterium]|nr:rhodanese-like domain-containing protein [Acidimicrobiaceae bacterium]